MKRALFIIFLLLLVIGGGLAYRISVDERTHTLSCPVESRACPDGSQVAHAPDSCDFPRCAPPNVTLDAAHVVFALPFGFVEESAAKGELARYGAAATTTEQRSEWVVRSYPIAASSTAVDIMHATAMRGTSSERVSPADFTSLALGQTYRFAAVTIERSSTKVTVAYYLARPADVLRFDATDYGIDGTNSAINISELPAQKAMRTMLATLASE